MSIKEQPPRRVHLPVLLEATLSNMQPTRGESYLDLTAGYGGHATAFLRETGNNDSSVLVDRDDSVVSYLSELVKDGAEFRRTDFLSAAESLIKEGRTFDLILADLGVSSPQLDRADRGFSFSKSGPLDMRMDQSNEKDAATIVNTYSIDALQQLIIRYGEEKPRDARYIAEAIVRHRPYEDTAQLGERIKQSIRRPYGKIHPATRTFQALRIEVNDELQQIEALMPLLPRLLNSNGRVGVISFHSLEDRIIKRYFKEQDASGFEAELQSITKKPLSGATYDVSNPRSRSAKLRIAVKK